MDLRRTAWKTARHSFTSEQYLLGGVNIKAQIGRSPRWIPAFVADEFQFRSVLIEAVVQYVFRGRNVPQNISDDLAYLKVLAADGFTRHSFGRPWDDSILTKMIGHIEAMKKAGGYLQFVAAVMYRAWKLNWHAHELAEELGISAKAVQHQLARLVAIAEKLGYPTRPKRNSYRGKTEYTPAQKATRARAGAKWHKNNTAKWKAARARRLAQGGEELRKAINADQRKWYAKRQEEAFLKTVACGARTLRGF